MENIDSTPSRAFKGYDWSEHTSVDELIETLFVEYSAWYRSGGENRRIQGPDKIKQHLKHFVLEAFRTYRAMPALLMGVHLGNSYYNENKNRRYRPTHLSYRIVRNVTDFLLERGYLEMPFGKGEWSPKESDRRMTRYRATIKLMKLCDDNGINRFMIGTYPLSQPEIIILRDKKKKGKSGVEIDYDDTDFTIQARKNLLKINDFLSSHHINLDITDDQQRELERKLSQREDAARDSFIDFTKTGLKRIFNNSSFEQGGRFYGGWWQQIPSYYRYFITVDGKRTVQLDYSGMHFAVMYADMGMETPMDDPYTLPDYGSHLRSDIKIAFNIIINCATKQMAAAAIDKRIQDGKLSSKLESGEKLMQAFSQTHPLIKDKIASGEGVKGQFVDSRVAERLLLKGMEIDLCILPIHDGFITTAGDEFVLKQLMDDAFFDITEQQSRCKPESFDLSIIKTKNDNNTHWVTRPDGTVERDGIIEGKAISYTEARTEGQIIWERLVDDSYLKILTKERETEWVEAHNHHKY